MGLVTRAHESGLVLAEDAVDEARLSHGLRQIDRSLVLQFREGFYCVVQMVSDDYAPVVFVWADEHGNPLPLSSGLLEELKKWRPEARSRRGPDADQRNEQLVAGVRKKIAAEREAVIGDHKARVEKGRMSVGLSTRGRRHYRESDRRLR